MKEPTELAKELMELTAEWRATHISWCQDDTQEKYNRYDDAGEVVRVKVMEILFVAEHNILVKCDSFQRIIESAAVIGWDNGHWFHWFDGAGRRFGIDWLAIEQIEIT
jgi:hypothetical protein